MQGKNDNANTRSSRRAFFGSSGALAAGVYLAHPSIAGAAETLAVSGGKKAVTAPAGDAASWPRFGEEEIDAVNAVVRSPGYGEVAAFEKDWQEHFEPPFCNGSSPDEFTEVVAR